MLMAHSKRDSDPGSGGPMRTIHLRVGRDHYAAMQAAAEAEGVCLSEITRTVIALGLAECERRGYVTHSLGWAHAHVDGVLWSVPWHNGKPAIYREGDTVLVVARPQGDASSRLAKWAHGRWIARDGIPRQLLREVEAAVKGWASER